jgi:hypothetical protein
MIKFIQTINKLSVIIYIAVFILPGNLSWAWDTYFSDYALHDLKIMAVDVEEETVTIKSADGEIAVMTVGDVIGLGSYTINEINDKIIKLENPPDDRGKTRKGHLPAVRIDTLKDLTPVEHGKLKRPMK